VIDQLLSELRKMRSTRTNLGLLAGMVGLTLLAVLINGFVLGAAELARHDDQHTLLSAGTSGALFASLIGVMAITSEFRHGTIRSTFLVTPDRTRVIAAKVIASLLMGILFGIVAIGLSLGLGYAILRIRGIDFALDTGHVVLLVLGTLLMTALWAALGVGVGAGRGAAARGSARARRCARQGRGPRSLAPAAGRLPRRRRERAGPRSVPGARRRQRRAPRNAGCRSP